MKKLWFFSYLIATSLTMKAQDVAFHTIQKLGVSHKLSSQVTPLITEDQFIYSYMGSDVLVEFNGEEHIEYHQNKKYHIKSKVKWISNHECYLIIQECTVPSLPFKRGEALYLKILKISHSKVVYQSTFRARSWKGKMKAH